MKIDISIHDLTENNCYRHLKLMFPAGTTVKTMTAL